MNSNVLVRGDARTGQFIDDRTAIGRWEIRAAMENSSASAGGAMPSGRRVHVVFGHQFDAYRNGAMLPEGLGYLCPDAAIITYDVQRTSD